MAKVIGQNIPQEIAAQFLAATQLKGSLGGNVTQKARPTVGKVAAKSFAARSPFIFWGTLWKTFSSAQKSVWQAKHTETGARGWGEYVQNEVNRIKKALLSTDTPDEIVNPCGVIFNTLWHSPTPQFTWERFYNDFVLSDPMRPSRKQFAFQLDLTGYKKFGVHVKVKTKYFAATGLPDYDKLRFYLVRYHQNNHSLYDFDDVRTPVDANGEIDVTHIFDFTTSSQDTWKILVGFETSTMGGDFFQKLFVVWAIDEFDRITYLTTSPDLRDANKIFKGHLSAVVNRVKLYADNQVKPLFIQLWAKD